MSPRIAVVETISPQRAAEILHVSIRTIRRYIASGKVTAEKTHNGLLILDRREVEALLIPRPVDPPIG